MVGKNIEIKFGEKSVIKVKDKIFEISPDEIDLDGITLKKGKNKFPSQIDLIYFDKERALTENQKITEFANYVGNLIKEQSSKDNKKILYRILLNMDYKNFHIINNL